MIQITIEKKDVYLLAAIIVFLASSIYVMAVWSPQPQYHEGNELKVVFNGTQYSLQELIDMGRLGKPNHTIYCGGPCGSHNDDLRFWENKCKELGGDRCHLAAHTGSFGGDNIYCWCW